MEIKRKISGLETLGIQWNSSNLSHKKWAFWDLGEWSVTDKLVIYLHLNADVSVISHTPKKFFLQDHRILVEA